MTVHLDADSLRQGALSSLVHCTHLAEDAAIMYAAKRISSSFHLAVMAREELGRFNLLLEQSIDLGDGGTICARELADRLKRHEDKLRAGQSIVPVPMKADEMTKWTAAITANDIATIRTISDAVRKRATSVRQHAPSALHKRRLQAQYVDLNPRDGTWSKPSDIEKTEARALIQTVMAEIANVLIAAGANPSLHQTSERIGQRIPEMGPFTQKVLGNLMSGDA